MALKHHFGKLLLALTVLLLALGAATFTFKLGKKAPIQGGIFNTHEMKGQGLEPSLRVLTNYGSIPQWKIDLITRGFEVFSESPHVDFADFVADQTVRRILESQNLRLLGGPMLGEISETGGSVWVRTIGPASVTVRVDGQSEPFGPVKAEAEDDFAAVIRLTGLQPKTNYSYTVFVDGQPVAEGVLKTVNPKETRIVFGSCTHRWGLHYQEFWDQVLRRDPHALLIYGDIAVQDRKFDFAMHRFDYFLRDMSATWKRTAARLPVYATWDDHDYIGNDQGGLGKGGSDADRQRIRQVFQNSWNNPAYGFGDEKGGIFFRTRIGPADILMTDNRYFRGEEGKFLGDGQMEWLESQLLDCHGPFIVLTCGTLWSDYKLRGKDSWGKFDPAGRERIFSLIEKHRIPGVLLLSGDWHGARGYTIQRPSGYTFYEFQPASLGGREGGQGRPLKLRQGPKGQWLFGYGRRYAFGELSFDTQPKDPTATFRLIFDDGTEYYKLTLTRSQLTPQPPQ